MTKENCCTGNAVNKKDFTTVQMVKSSDCDCNTHITGCCDSNTSEEENAACCSAENGKNSSCDCNTPKQEEQGEHENVDFNITIDGRNVRINDASKNIVEVAKMAGISIPAPCFLANRKHGCCNACVVDINDKQHYACGTTPEEGMVIEVNRADLIALRKERLLKYKAGIKNGRPLKCGRS